LLTSFCFLLLFAGVAFCFPEILKACLSPVCPPFFLQKRLLLLRTYLLLSRFSFSPRESLGFQLTAFGRTYAFFFSDSSSLEPKFPKPLPLVTAVGAVVTSFFRGTAYLSRSFGRLFSLRAAPDPFRFFFSPFACLPLFSFSSCVSVFIA